jgi:hypothetical protein
LRSLCLPGSWVFSQSYAKVRIKRPLAGFDGAGMRDAGHSQTQIATGLHVCPKCGSCLVQPTCWEQTADRARWRVWRRCPNCEWCCDGVHGEREIDDFDEQLDIGTHELADELRALERESMAQMIEAFVTALDADLISAEDFH